MSNHTKKGFIALINKKRLENKNDWYLFVGNVEGKKVIIKGFNTWLQRFAVDGVDHSNTMENSVSKFKSYIEGAL
jgi:hypothetical protein